MKVTFVVLSVLFPSLCRAFFKNSKPKNTFLTQIFSIARVKNEKCCNWTRKAAAALVSTGFLFDPSGLSLLPREEFTAIASLEKDFSKAKFPLFEEVWSNLNENFYDNTFNGQNWRRVKADAEAKLDEGADEHKLIAKVLSGLGDKYTRLVDKKTFENLFKYDAIGVGLLFQSDAGEPLRVSGPPTTGSSSEKAGMKKGDYILSINGRSAKDMSAMSVLDMMSNDQSPSVTLEYFRASPEGLR